MHNSEPASTGYANERLVKILNSTYVKADIEQVAANTTYINAE